MTNLKIFASLILGVLFTSCLGDSGSTMTMTRQLLPAYNFSYITDRESNESSIIATGSTTSLSIDFNAQTCGVNVSGLMLRPGGASYSFTIDPAKFSYDRTGALVMNIPTYTDALSGTRIDNMSIRMLDRVVNGSGIPVWNLSYTIDNKYDVVVVQNNIFLFGDSRFTDEDGKAYETNQPYYAVYFDNKTVSGTGVEGKVYMYNVQFSSSLQQTNLVIDKVPFRLTSTGFTASADNLKVFNSNNTEQTDLAVTDFSINGRFKQEILMDNPIPNVVANFNIGDFKAYLNVGYTIQQKDQQAGV